jgi:hypothetical protein
MGWGGSVQAMITSLRNNKNLLPKRKSLYEKDKRKNINYSISEGLNCDIVATEEQLLEIRTRIQKRNKRKKILNSLIITISVMVVLYLSYLNSQKEVLIQSPEIETIINEQEVYLNYIKYGDTWVEDKKWKAAIYSYQKAVDLAPDDYYAQYRLALAFSYHCAYEKFNCEEGIQLLNELITKFGSNQDLEYLLGIIDNR